ncbi:MFS transporter [Alkalilimnicola ehrlichii]|uniref:MFS transporter n=1 Tax=Alkalilimnicola ehrlichii TaxID=351052 RepID=A0A3E0WVG4_9GAMM|nr:MFS transporter [Alkalilimnicola ehrlichii]RFA29239.1 MFS transporter [Alkalilimnicola ehrlichii]RFA36151.1 MFS transporter [Alkalilimnicola ehrlichii]
MSSYAGQHTPPSHTGAGIREWLGLAVLALPTLLLGLDVTLLYLALPALALDLQPSSTQALWIMDIYGFMIAGFLITMGNLGDRIGRRRLLLIGAGAFGIASVVAAYSVNAEMLIAARAALGVAGATLMPSTLALISNMFSLPRQRALAIGVWATMFALGMAAGPIVGGLLLDLFWWGAAFLAAVPVIAILLITAPLLLPEYRSPTKGRLDPVSVLLSLAAILSSIYGIKEMAKIGFELQPLVALAAGIALSIVFVRRQHRLETPLLDMKLFSSRTFSAALVVLLVGLVGVSGVMLLVTQYLQLVAGLSPLMAGLWMGPPALAMVAAGITAPLIARRIRPGLVVATALALSTVGYLLLTQLKADASGIIIAVTGFSFVYLGLGTIAALGTDLVVGAAPVAKAGSASAMSEMVQELGVALGVAVLGSVATLVYRANIGAHLAPDLATDVSTAMGDSLWAATAIGDSLADNLLQEAQAAFTLGLNVIGLVGGIGIIGLAIISAVSLRHVQTLSEAP